MDVSHSSLLDLGSQDLPDEDHEVNDQLFVDAVSLFHYVLLQEVGERDVMKELDDFIGE